MSTSSPRSPVLCTGLRCSNCRHLDAAPCCSSMRVMSGTSLAESLLRSAVSGCTGRCPTVCTGVRVARLSSSSCCALLALARIDPAAHAAAAHPGATCAAHAAGAAGDEHPTGKRIADMVGVTGLKNLRAIGEAARNSQVLAQMKHKGIHASVA